RLVHMNESQALEAVLKPGGSLVTPEIAKQIVRVVAGEDAHRLEDAEIDPALLSLVCSELNEQRRVNEQAQISPTNLASNRDGVLGRFYESCLENQPPAVRVFVEDELVSDSGYRESITVERAVRELSQAGASGEAIKQLVDRRLLRIEERLGTSRVELAHDILTRVVIPSRQMRRAREEKEALELRQRRAEEQK